MRSRSNNASGGDAVLDLRYPGGKGVAGLADWIIAQQPAHVWYAEPFAGKGAVARRKPPALKTWLVDDDPAVLAWWSRFGLPGSIAICGDGIRFCELAAEWGPAELLLYVDPPYLMSTRSGRRLYRHELTVADHERLLAALLACRCSVMVSGYDSPLYRDRLAGWSVASRRCMTRGGLRDEFLWTNFTPGELSIVPDYSQLGGCFRERARVAKKVRRWVANLATLPDRERDVLMRALIAANVAEHGRLRRRRER
ncbi:MAG: hypothetical protein R3B90_21770 [Planctomycetaceae bacterium]